MNNLPATLLALTLGSSALSAGADDSSAFWAFMRKADHMQDRRQALDALDAARRQFPAREFEISMEMAAAYAQTGQPEKSMEIWQAGHKKGLFFGLFPQFDWLQPFQKFPQFQSILDRDKELREQADRTATMRYEVVTPAGYSTARKYPLFIVLHAGQDSIEHARTYWTSGTLSREYVVVYVQAARQMSSKTYGWRDDDPEMRAGLRRFYDETVAKYPVDTNRVLIGGMSAGGFMSLDVVVHNVLPVTGYVVNCPGVPSDFEPAMADQMRQRGVRGVILTGEKDFGLAPLKELVAVFTKAGVPHRFTVIPGMGHEVPDDFPARLAAALIEVDGPAGRNPRAD